MKTFFLLTNDPNRVVEIRPGVPVEDCARVIDIAQTPYDVTSIRFQALTNTLKPAAMKAARAEVRELGLKLSQSGQMFA